MKPPMLLRMLDATTSTDTQSLVSHTPSTTSSPGSRTSPAVEATTEDVPRSLSPVEEPAVAQQQTKVAPTTEKNKRKFHGGQQKGKKDTDKRA
jgi:hypothetical protein